MVRVGAEHTGHGLAAYLPQILQFGRYAGGELRYEKGRMWADRRGDEGHGSTVAGAPPPGGWPW